MFVLVERGGCQCISFILQLFFTNCMSISVSIFCCTKLCPAWNDVGKILRFPCALLKPPAVRSLQPSTISDHEVCLKLSGLDGKTGTSILSTARETLPRYPNSSSTTVVPSTGYQTVLRHPSLTPTSPEPWHLVPSKIRYYSTLQQPAVSQLGVILTLVLNCLSHLIFFLIS